MEARRFGRARPMHEQTPRGRAALAPGERRRGGACRQLTRGRASSTAQFSAWTRARDGWGLRAGRSQRIP